MEKEEEEWHMTTGRKKRSSDCFHYYFDCFFAVPCVPAGNNKPFLFFTTASADRPAISGYTPCSPHLTIKISFFLE